MKKHFRLLMLLAALPAACLAGGGGGGMGGGGMGDGGDPYPDISGFNAVQPGGAYNGDIYTKLAGTAFSLDILALKSSNTTIYTGFGGSVSVQLLDASNDSGGQDSASGCRSSWTSISGATATASSFSSGRKTVSFTVNNAYKDVVARMTYNSVVSCSFDNFAIRPTNFTVSSTNMVYSDQSAPFVTDGTPKAKAGASFNLNVTTTQGYNGTPKINNGQVQAHPGAASNGTVSGSFPAASNGVASGNGFSYSEVGLFKLAANGVYDNTFTDVDRLSNECVVDSFSNTLSGGKYGCNFGNNAVTSYFGRFYPDHFDIVKNTPRFYTAAGSFTYVGQPFIYRTSPVLTVSAKNAAGNTTSNYTGDWMKIASATLTGKAYSAASGTLDTSGIPGTDPVIADLGGGLVALTFASGSGLKFQRGGSPTAPFDAEISLAISVADGDGVTYASNPARFGVAAAGQGIAFDDGHVGTTTDKEMRYGRLRLANAQGSELLALPVSLTAQYWNGQGFVSNSADDSTTLATPTLTFYAQTADNQLASGETTASFNTPLVAGDGNLRFSAPGTGNFGYLDLSIAAPAWLKFNWDGVDQGGDGDLLDDNPRARATFGKRKGSDRVIIRRELY